MNKYDDYWDKEVIEKGNYEDYLTEANLYKLKRVNNLILSKLPTDKKVLDVGCGTGLSTSFYKNHCKELHGVDYSKEAIKTAKKRQNNINFHQADIKELPFPDNYFDIVICQGVLHHLIKINSIKDTSKEHLYKGIQEVDRVGNGLILINEVNGWNLLRKYKEITYYPKINRNEWSYTFRTWKNIFKKFGYKLVYYKYNSFIPEGISNGKMFKVMKSMEDVIEKIPLLNRITGGIFFVAEKIK